MKPFLWKNKVYQFLLLLLPIYAIASEYPTPEVERFIRLESENSMVVRSTVDPKYRAQYGNIFDLPYIDLPEELLGTVENKALSGSLKKHFRVTRDGQPAIRFFIHPESLSLYEQLIKRFGITGHYRAAPTTSTRSLLVWNPKEPQEFFFVKASLAKRQDGLGRVVPGWEVRRSVKISELFDLTAEQSTLEGTRLIQEGAGAYLKADLGIGYKVDEIQGKVFEHGYILRDASFLKTPYGEPYPFFALFTERKGAPPRVVEWFKASGERNFHTYLEKTIIQPYFERVGPLLFQEGIYPEIHSQNTVVAIDPNSKHLTYVYHRDVGSMKVDIQNRLIRGKSIGHLQTKNAAYDFKFHRPASAVDGLVDNYFFEMTFSLDRDMGYGRALQKYQPEYDPEKIKRIVRKHYRQQLKKYLSKGTDSDLRTGKQFLTQWYLRSRPNPTTLEKAKQPNPKQAGIIDSWAWERFESAQFMDLPSSWLKQFRMGYTLLPQGLVERTSAGRLLLYYWDETFQYARVIEGRCPEILQKIDPAP